MMKVAFITHYQELYGANRSLLTMLDGLSEYELSPYVISPEQGGITDEIEARDIPVSIVPFCWWVGESIEKEDQLFVDCYRTVYAKLRGIKRLLKNIRAVFLLVKQLRAWDIDIIYSNSSVIPIGIVAAKILGIPHVWHIREFLDLHYHFSYDLGKWTYTKTIAQSDRVVVISEVLKKYWENSIAAERLYNIYNSVASRKRFESLYQENSTFSGAKENFTFSIVGYVHPSKGVAEAVNALARVVKKKPDVCLLIVGNGDDEYVASLKQLTGKLNLEKNVEFWGEIKDPYEAYLISDAVLMCSKFEAMGRVTVEAMAACKPVIGYDSGGTAELISHEETGLLYSDESKELAHCMMRLIEDQKWAHQLGVNAYHFASKHFTYEHHSKEIFAMLAQLYGRDD